jgi:hypothetical protein
MGAKTIPDYRLRKPSKCRLNSACKGRGPLRSAINILSRLELLCKDVGRPLLMTDTFAVEVAEPVIEIGHFELRGFRLIRLCTPCAKRGSNPAVPNRPPRSSPTACASQISARRYRRYARCWRRTPPPSAGAHCRSARRRQCHEFRSPLQFRRNKIHAELAFGKVQPILRVIFFQAPT